MPSPRLLFSGAARRSRRALERRASCEIDPTASVGSLHVSGWGARGRLVVGPRSVLQDGVVLQLSEGGTIEIGPDVTVRRGAVLNVSGHLELRGRNLVSWYSVVHCQQSVVFEELAGTGEGVTIVDGTHFRGEAGTPEEHWHRNSRPDPVWIGRNTWLAAKCTVAAGARLGANVTVAGHAFVRAGDHPDGATLVGVPARRVGSPGRD